MATAHVSGAVAIMQVMALKHDKTLMPEDVKDIFWQTASEGRIDLLLALEAVKMLP